MPTMQEVRAKYPQYSDMNDADLAGALHRKFYSDMPVEEFNAKIGLGQPAAQQSTANSAVLGALDTATFGFADEIGSGLDWVADKLPGGQGRTYDELLALNREAQTGAQDQHPIAYTGGQVAGAVLPGVGLARAGVSAGARAVEAGRPLWQVAAGSALDGAAMGAAQGFGSGEGMDDRLKQASTGFGYGLGGGLAAPYIGAGIGATVRRAVSPVASTPGRQAVVDALTREGVELSAGQRTGSKMLGYAESQIGGQRAADLYERQGEQFTQAVLQRAGINANRATPDVIDDGFRQIGGMFDDLGARNTLVPDSQMAGDIGSAVQEYASLVPESQRAPIVQNLVADLRDLMQAPIAGDRYQALRSRLDRTARGAKADPQLSHALSGIRTAVDDAMERSIAANNPADAGAWAEARRRYRNILTIERAITGAGSDTAMGLVSPSQLRNATVQQNRRAYARGDGDFAELARAGEAILKPLPNSGTAPRTAAMALGAGVPAVAGTIMGSGGGAAGMALGGIVGTMAPYAAGRAMMSRAGQAYLSNQNSQYLQLSPARRAIVDALMRSESSAAAGRLAP